MSTTITNERSSAQAEASRTNGSKSQGPITIEGKSKVSRNRTTHGFRSSSITLNDEDKPAYDAHFTAYLARYTPADQVEEDLVGLLASSMWQLMRFTSMEAALFDLEVARLDRRIDDILPGLDQWGRLALAFRKSAGDNAFETLRRYKASVERAYHRAFQALEEIERTRQSSQPAPDPPEINPAVQTREPLDQQETDVKEPRSVLMFPGPSAASLETPLLETQS